MFETAWGKTPAAAADCRRALGVGDLRQLLETHRQWTPTAAPAPRVGELWPLLSHHTFPTAGGLRGLQGQPEVLTRRLLVQLLGCHGLVLADPIPPIAEIRERQGEEAALRTLTAVVARLAQLQPLLGADVLRITAARPRITDGDRAAVLATLGFEDLRLFTDMIEWAEFIIDGSRADQALYVRQAIQIHDLLGVSAPHVGDSFPHAAQAVVRLAAAIIEVSWQVAVCARESSCDVFVGDDLERQLFATLMDRTLNDQELAGVTAEKDGRSRYISRLAAGQLPRLDTAHLTTADALALRRDDSFERWRSALEEAIDSYDAASVFSGRVEEARRRFTESMKEASDRLQIDAKRSKFITHFTPQAVPAGIAVLGAVATADHGMGLLASEWAVAAAGAAVVSQWISARRTSGTNVTAGSKVLRRYVAEFGTTSKEQS